MPIKRVAEAAEWYVEVKTAIARLDTLREAQERMMDVLDRQDKRIREIEASLREVRSELKYETLKETQSIVNSVQGHLYKEIRELSVQLEKVRNSPIDGSKKPLIE